MSDDWIFDSLIGFLRGPVWNVPILTFLEHKSLGKYSHLFFYARRIECSNIYFPGT